MSEWSCEQSYPSSPLIMEEGIQAMISGATVEELWCGKIRLKKKKSAWYILLLQPKSM